MATGEQVLVAVMNRRQDFAIASDEHWYRIPVIEAQKWIGRRWPPLWLAFYQTKVFEQEQHAVNYYAEVQDVRQASRRQLFPEQAHHPRAGNQYYQLVLGPLQRLSAPIASRRKRKVVFIPTTWAKFASATEINDLFDDSPLEDRLWAEFKRLKIPAERQEFLDIEGQHFALDFAIYCCDGKIDVETDGDAWHANRERSPEDNRRNNALTAAGWKVLRFTTAQIMNKLAETCLPTIEKTINRLGGIDEGGVIPRKIDLKGLERGLSQKGLFDSP